MVMVFGKESKVIVTLENGGTRKLKDTEYINGRMETSMKVNGNIV